MSESKLFDTGSKLFDTDGIPERIFEKDDFEKNQQTTKSMKNYPVGKDLTPKVLITTREISFHFHVNKA